MIFNSVRLTGPSFPLAPASSNGGSSKHGIFSGFCFVCSRLAHFRSHPDASLIIGVVVIAVAAVCSHCPKTRAPLRNCPDSAVRKRPLSFSLSSSWTDGCGGTDINHSVKSSPFGRGALGVYEVTTGKKIENMLFQRVLASLPFETMTTGVGLSSPRIRNFSTEER